MQDWPEELNVSQYDEGYKAEEETTESAAAEDNDASKDKEEAKQDEKAKDEEDPKHPNKQ